MKKIITTSALLMLIFVSKSVYSQDKDCEYKKIGFRVFGGPELQFMLKGDSSTMRGGKFGFNSGGEVNFNLNQHFQLFTGLYFNVSNFARWINYKDSVKASFSNERMDNFEIPIGFRYSFGLKPQTGFFAGLSFINSLTTGSSSKLFIVKPNYEVQDNNFYKVMRTYNFGFKGEVGYNFNYGGITRYALTLGMKPMFYGYKDKEQKFTTFATSLTLGICF